jgi:hypothetical protein
VVVIIALAAGTYKEDKNMTEEMKKKEAVKRMKMLKMLDQPIKEFEEEGKLNKSEYGIGILYWLNEEEEKAVKEFEDQNEAVVYHVILDNTVFGQMYSFLYVSNYEEEWSQDRQDIKEGQALAYVKSDICGEFGSIGVIPMTGGVKRIW